jgi:hypothetical protein
VTCPVIPITKITEYLLNVDHLDGGPKAKFFIAGGFSPERPLDLAQALIRHFTDNPPTTKNADRFGGVRITIKAPMPVPDGRTPMVLSVWTIDERETVPRLITAYPGD